MKDLISRQALLDTFNAWLTTDYSYGEKNILKACVDEVETAPPAERPRLIRCKDCVHWQPSKEGTVEIPFCKSLGIDAPIGSANDYCSYGLRRGGER